MQNCFIMSSIKKAQCVGKSGGELSPEVYVLKTRAWRTSLDCTKLRQRSVLLLKNAYILMCLIASNQNSTFTIAAIVA